MDDHRSDVASPAGAVPLADEPIDGFLRVSHVLKNRRDLVLAEHAGEPVSAEQNAVALPHLDIGLVDPHVSFDAERTREDASVRVILGLGLGDLPLYDHPMDERVI